MADAAEDFKMEDFVSEEEEEVKDAVEEGELSDDSEYDSANNVAEGEELTFDFVDAGPGEEFMAVKPWIGAMKEPSSHSPADVNSSPPDEALELSYAFGYRCRGVFDNVHFSAAGELVYPAAAIGVIANPEDGSQRFYQGHVDDIMCLAVDSTGTLAATGGKASIDSRGRRALPAVHIWDIATGEAVAVIKGTLKRQVTALAFSPDSKQLVAVGKDNNHTLAAFSVATGELIGKVATGTDPVFAVKWSAKTGLITTSGVKHCSFWQLGSRGFGRQKKALYGSKGKRCTQLCLAETPGGRVWSGTLQGEIYMFRGNRLFAVKKAHSGHITALATGPEYMVSGGKDGNVHFWTVRGENIGTIAVGAPVRALNISGNTLAVGTGKGQVVTFSLGEAAAPSEGAEATVVTSGHFDGETWALATNPDGNMAVTAGDDNMIALWSLDDNKLITTRVVDATDSAKARHRAKKKGGGRSTMADTAPNQCCRAADWGMGGFIVVGTNDGKVLVLDEATLETVGEAQVADQAITVVKFDPGCEFVAVGSADSHAYIYRCTVDGALEKVSTCRGNSSYITHLDWDETGLAVQTCSGAYELLYYTAETGEQETHGGTLYRDETWATWTSTLGWPVQGIWYKCSKGSDINCVDRNLDGTLLAVGDDRGRIRLFRYPACDPEAKSSAFRGHASHLTNLRFTPGGETLLSVGGNDNTMLKWTVA